MKYLMTTLILCAVLLSFVGCGEKEPIPIKVKFSPSDTFAYTGAYKCKGDSGTVSASILKEFTVDCEQENDSVIAWAKKSDTTPGTLKLILLKDSQQVAIDSAVNNDTSKITVKYKP